MRYRSASSDAGSGAAHIRHTARLRSGYHAAGAGPLRRDLARAAGHARCIASRPPRHRARARRYDHLYGRGAGGILRADTSGTCRGGTAHPRHLQSVARGDEPSDNGAHSDLPLLSHAAEPRQPHGRRRCRREDRRHGQYGHRRAVHGGRQDQVGRVARCRVGQCPAGGGLRPCTSLGRPPHGVDNRTPPRELRRGIHQYVPCDQAPYRALSGGGFRISDAP